jgi:hypothetical protein
MNDLPPVTDGVAFSQASPHVLLERERLTDDERHELLEHYVSRGRALLLQGDRGLVDSHRRRQHHFGQFLTPTRVAQVLGRALGLLPHPAWARSSRRWTLPDRGSIVDAAGCGNGRLLQLAPPGWSLHGADVDPLACNAARLIYPGAEILQASLVEFRNTDAERFTVALVNPPFSLTLTSKEALPLRSAQWGVWGCDTSVTSHVAAIELASHMANLVGAILPTPALDADDYRPLRKPKPIRYDWALRLRLDLPHDAFRTEGTDWPCSIAIFSTVDLPVATHACETWDAVDRALEEWVSLQASRTWNLLDALDRRVEEPSLSAWRISASPPTVGAAQPLQIEAGAPAVRLALGGRGHAIRMKPNGLTAALAVHEARLRSGFTTSDGFEPQAALDWSCDLVRNAGHAGDSVQAVTAALRSLGLPVTVDAQLTRHATRADRRAHVELTAFAQWTRGPSGWQERQPNNDPAEHPAAALLSSRSRLFTERARAISTGLRLEVWDRERRMHTERVWPSMPIYDFAQVDIGRALAKRAVIYSAKQGLGKTRFSLGAVLASGVTRAVWVLETRLVDEFRRELRRLGLLDHFHLIDTHDDLRRLKTFNVVTYSRLWRPVTDGAEKRSQRWGPGKSFAAALARRRLFVVIDEAHKIKAATTKQGIAARHLCNRARRVLLMTGTAIQSYPRNILGLVAAGWGDGSALNPYGYRRPMRGGYTVDTGRSQRRRNVLIRGVTRFIDTFCDVVWYTPAFAQTASTGMKSREIPRLKNVTLWESFIRSKVIRRVPGEPEVRASGFSTPEARPIFAPVQPTPSHFAHYKLVLDRFAQIWRERLRREAATGHSESSAAHILPELDALRFASTVPVAPHRWAQADPRLRYASAEPTALMLEAVRRISAWVAAGDRVLVGAEKPDALRWLADLLADAPSHVPDAEPVPSLLALEPDIARRNAIIDSARDDAVAPVLLISVGMGKEGLNLPEFSKLLTLDIGWVPADLDQFRHRILRPDQHGDPEIVHLFNEGMIDSYMRQLCEAKADAIDQAIDGQESRYDYSAWKDYRTFALEMLEREGFAFAADALARERSPVAA